MSVGDEAVGILETVECHLKVVGGCQHCVVGGCQHCVAEKGVKSSG